MERLDLRALAALLLALAAACGGGGRRTDGPHPQGASSFTSPAPTVGRSSLDAPGAAAGGAPSASPGAEAPRAVEEADVYARSGSLLYALNAYRGLQIVDLSDPAAPRLRSRLPVEGTPVDLYLRGNTALVVLSDWFTYLAAADGALQPRRGSRLLAVDVSDPDRPALRADLAIEGELETTRIVGDVLYVFSRRWWWYDWIGPASPGGAVGAGVAGPAEVQDTALVASFDIADPAAPREVDRLELPAAGWSTHAQVTAQRATISFAGWGPDAQGAWNPLTRFQVVDLSDPGGALAGGAAFEAAGLLQDRWSMEHDPATGLFRAVLASGWNAGAELRIWRSPAPDQVEPLSSLAIPVPESLTAVRFDGPRVYLVTARNIDPLWVVDASDPARPRVAGELTMPGQLDFLEPRGDRLVALGHTSEAGGWQLAVSLFDVADLSAPVLLSRALFGSSWGWLGVSSDDLRKAFLVFDPPPAGIGLVLVPVQGWDQATWRYQGGTQLLDLSRDAVAARGFLAHPGAVSRAFPLDAAGQTLVALSDQALQTIDASDRGAPAERARLDLSRSVSTLAIVGEQAVELCGDWYRGDTELVVTPALDPDAAVPLARVPVAAPYARLFQDGSVSWLLARDAYAGTGWLQAVDLADPLHPRVRGRLALDAEQSPVGAPGCWGYGDEAVLAGQVLAVHRTAWMPMAGGCPTCGMVVDRIWLYDLSDPDHPALAATATLPGNVWSWGLTATGPYLWLTHYEWESASAPGRFWVDRIDVTDPAHPVVLPKVNVPGVFFAAAPDGRRIYTLETVWSERGGAWSATTWLHGLDLANGKAVLSGSAGIDGFPSGAALHGGHAYVAATTWNASTTTRLVAVETLGLTVAGETRVEGSWAWLSRAAGGKLFLQAGWQDQGVLVYALTDPAHPSLERFVRTRGWVSEIVVSGDRAWLPAGPYGVTVVPLAP